MSDPVPADADDDAVAEPQPMRLTERDGQILEAIHAFDGMLGDYQIKRLFFTGQRQTRERLSTLTEHGYLARVEERKQRASLPCQIYWLGKRGVEFVAGLHAQEVSEFPYLKHPRWAMVEHDLAVNDFRLTVVEACRDHPELELIQWVPAGEFWASPDTVEFAGPDGRKTKRKVRPDGYFVVKYQRNYRSRLLLELDRATEDNPRFAREKVLPGIAYLRSEAYQRRFEDKSGRWLVVTTSNRRMDNMLRQTKIAGGKHAGLFYFTTFDQVGTSNVLTAAIWRRVGEDKPVALFAPALLAALQRQVTSD